jgi:hypothetical protein
LEKDHLRPAIPALPATSGFGRGTALARWQKNDATRTAPFAVAVTFVLRIRSPNPNGYREPGEGNE